MKVLYDIQEMLEDELKKICKSDNITGTDLEEMDKMVDIIKDISTIEAMKNAELGGYSENNGGYSYAEASRRGYSETWPYQMPMYAREGGQSMGNSMARGRDSMGRYTSRDSSRDSNYSRDHSKEDILSTLEDMMMGARSEEEREKYRRAIEQLKR